MRILFCTLDYPPSAAGGAEQQARLQAEELIRRGHTVDVVCARAPGQSSGAVGGIQVHRLQYLPGSRVFSQATYLAMLAVFLVRRLRRYDLVHVHLANLQADVAVAIARLLGRPAYVKLAAGGPLGEIGRLRAVSWITRYFGLRHADAVQAISDEIAQDLRAIGVPPERIRRISNGVVPPRPRGDTPERSALRSRLGLDPATTLAVYAGRMERAKGVADLLAAWRHIETANAQLLLVGSLGLKDPVSMTELPPHVDYLGWTASLSEYLAAADLFIFPSHAEGMSNALLEAMASGLPAIATRVGAADEMIVDGDNGMLVGAGDVQALAHALERLIQDEAMRIRLGAKARDTIRRKFGIGPVVTAIERAYRDIVRMS